MARQERKVARNLLRLRSHVKKSKPAFVRPESWRNIRLKESWRRPRGLDHKMRRKIKGWPPTVNVGYRGPKVARGLHPSGYKELLISNIAELGEIDPKTQAIRIAHTVGKRKRVKIIAEARKKKITILNVKETVEKAEKEKEVTEEKEEEEKPEEKQETTEGVEKEKPKRGKKTKKRKERSETQ
jgi:large subunit ribosomal protein L32e